MLESLLSVLGGACPGGGIAGARVNSLFNFRGTIILLRVLANFNDLLGLPMDTHEFKA